MKRYVIVVVACALAACGASRQTLGLPSTPAMDRGVAHNTSGPYGKIQHIVIVIQENRTVDNIFGGPKPFPGADAVSSGQTSGGKTKKLSKVYFFPSLDVNNYHTNYLAACNAPNPPPFTVGQPSPCRMNGFDKNQTFLEGEIYSYLDYSETKPYWDIAKKYTLADHFFMSHNSESYTAHQYLFSGQSNDVIQDPVFPSGFYPPFLTPWGYDSPKGSTTYLLDPKTGQQSKNPDGPFPCSNYKSLADLLNDKQKSWRLYAWTKHENINALDVNKSIRYSDLWDNGTNFREPETKFLKDIKNKNLPLADVTWILPGPLSSIIRERRRFTGRRGSPMSLMPSARAGIGTTPPFSSPGTIGAASTITLSRTSFATKFGPGVRVPLLVVSHMPSKVTFRKPIPNRERCWHSSSKPLVSGISEPPIRHRISTTSMTSLTGAPNPTVPRGQNIGAAAVL